MSDNIQQVTAKKKGAPLKKFAIQFGESSDAVACTHLLTFAPNVSGKYFKKKLLFYHTLDLTTRGEDIYNEAFNFFEKEGLSGIMYVY